MKVVLTRATLPSLPNVPTGLPSQSPGLRVHELPRVDAGLKRYLNEVASGKGAPASHVTQHLRRKDRTCRIPGVARFTSYPGLWDAVPLGHLNQNEGTSNEQNPKLTELGVDSLLTCRPRSLYEITNTADPLAGLKYLILKSSTNKDDMKCYFFFQLAPADKHYDQVCTLEEPEDFRALLRHCEDAGLRKGSVVGNSFMLEVEEDDERVQDLIGLLRSMNRIAVWGSFSPIRQDVRYFCIKRSRVYSKREMDAATFFSNVEWGGNLMCFGKYLENETLCVADSFRPKVKIGGVSKFGGGFLVRNEVKCSLEEKGLNGLNFQEAKFDRNDFMPGEVWKLDSNKHVSNCLLPYFGSIDIDNGETYEVMRYDDSGIIPEQLRFPESISREVSGYDFATVVHEKPSPRWSTANSFIFSKRFKEVLAGFGVSRIRWSPVAFERDS